MARKTGGGEDELATCLFCHLGREIEIVLVGEGGLEGCGGEGGSWVGGGKWEKGDGWLAKWDFGLVPKPWEYEGKRRGKDGRSGTLKQRDVDRWMIMGFFFFGETTVIVREGKK